MEIQAKLRKTYMRVETNSHSDSESSTHCGISSTSGGGGVISTSERAVGALASVGSLLPTSVTNNAYSALPDRSDSPADSMKCQNTTAAMMYSMRGIGKLHHSSWLKLLCFVVLSFLIYFLNDLSHILQVSTEYRVSNKL